MERILQYIDDLDDLYGMFGLMFERLRRLCVAVVYWCSLCGVALAGIGLAVLHPPMALATGTLLFVRLLYRLVTAPAAGRQAQTA